MSTEMASVRTAGRITATGAAGVVVTSLCYALSPQATTMPVAPLDLAAALAGARSGSPLLPAIAYFGLPFDVLTAAGLILLALLQLRRRTALETLGLILVGLASFFFLGVDALVGAALPALAAEPPAFLAVKVAVDQFFIAGVVCLSLGGLGVAIGGVGLRGWLRLAVGAAGGVGILSAAGALAGQNLAQPMGLSLAVIAALFVLIGLTAHVRGVQPEAG